MKHFLVSKQKITLFFWVLVSLLIIEGASFSSYFNPLVGIVVGGIIVLATLVISLKSISNGLLVVVAELLLGSQGYLFSFDIAGSTISLRIALWIIVMGVWISNLIGQFLRDKNFDNIFKNIPYQKPFIFLLSVLGFGVIVGLLSGNNQLFFFLELKRWLYILILFPFITSFRSTEELSKLFTVIVSAIVALCIKVLLLIYIFSHSFLPLVYDVYGWMRQNLLGEITRWPSGFSRIFMQSQIFLLPGVTAFFLAMYTKIQNHQLLYRKKFFGIMVVTLSCFSVIIASLSRSFWLGAIIGVIVTAICYIAVYRPHIKKILGFCLVLGGTVVVSTALLFAVVRFPFPKPSANIDASLLTDRAIKMEAGAASRWSLLPVMWQEIKKSPFFGYGFGKSLTYKTYDPRIVATGSNGLYTTYAFEWGWLDIWLKFGLLGLIAYGWLLWLLCQDAFKLLKKEGLVGSVILFSLVSLVTVHFFTPYLNHPLGFGYLALIIVFLESRKNSHLSFAQN